MTANPICSIQYSDNKLTCFTVCVSDCTDGIEFFWSENGVLLTAGDTEGKLLPKYFSQALKLKPTSKKDNHVDELSVSFF